MLYTLSNDKPVLVVSEGDSPTLIVNRDLVNTIVYGSQQIAGSNINAIALIDPLGSVLVDGTQDVYLLAAAGNPIADVVTGSSGWTPSPAQTAAQIAALGLARDSSVLSVNATLGTPAQTSDINNVNTTLAFGTNPNIQALGGAANRSIAQDMLFANKGTTTEIAALIATGAANGSPGGVPLLRGTKTLNNGSVNIGASGNSILVNNLTITQPGFESTFVTSLPVASGTVPFAQIQFQWIDSATSTTLETKNYFATAGNGPGNAVTTYVNGPCYGDKLLVTAFNLDPAQTLTFGFVINQTAHFYEHDHVLQAGYPPTAPNGFTNPNGQPSASILAQSNPSIGPNGQQFRLMAAFKGQAIINVDNGAQANIARVALVDPANIYGGGTNFALFNDTIGAGNRAHFPVYLPGGPVLLQLFNTQVTNTIVLGVTVMMLDL